VGSLGTAAQLLSRARIPVGVLVVATVILAAVLVTLEVAAGPAVLVEAAEVAVLAAEVALVAAVVAVADVIK
jgi:hypothetical protein